MYRIKVLAVILVFLVVTEGSDASLLWKIRKMVEGKSPVTEISPSPEPMIETGSSSNNSTSGKSGVQNPNNSTSSKPILPNPPIPINSTKDVVVKVPEGPKGGSHTEKDGNQEGMGETCEESSNRCTDQEKMIACLQRPENGSEELFVLVQNQGKNTLTVDVTVPDSIKISSRQLEIPKYQARKINVSVNMGENHEIVLKAGHGLCVLHIGVPISEGNFFQWIPSYANMVTPMYGAYFMVVLVIIVGGTWVCCTFVKRRRRVNDGVPYQELEMGLPESSSAAVVETADGWDQGWDDDWDEERAVRSPGHRVGNVSANGLTSRSPNKDGWENDWDD